MFPNKLLCPRLASLGSALEAVISTAAHLELSRLQEILDTHKLGEPWRNSIDKYFDITQARKCHGMAMPCGDGGTPCVDEELSEAIEPFAHRRFQEVYGDAQFARLAMGSFISELHEQLELAHALDNAQAQIALYGGHDTTIGPLIAALGEPEEHWPPYASHIIIELWRVASDDSKASLPGANDWVRVLYNGQPVSVSCGINDAGFCTYDAWAGWIEREFSSQAIESLCSTEQQSHSCGEGGDSWMVGTLSVLLLLTLAVLVFIIARERQSGKACFSRHAYRLVELDNAVIDSNDTDEGENKAA
jgi:hypothetical protein